MTSAGASGPGASERTRQSIDRITARPLVLPQARPSWAWVAMQRQFRANTDAWLRANRPGLPGSTA
jgi:hypothetical protein